MTNEFFNTEERWLPVPEYEGWYSVSNWGRVRREHGRFTGRIRATPVNKDGYHHVDLYRYGKGKTITVHSLVMSAFVGPRPDGMHIDHIDFCRINNKLENLRYVSPRENVNHSSIRMFATRRRGEANNLSKLTEIEVQEIRKLRFSGEKQSVIAKRFGIHQACVSAIARGKTWAFLK